MSKTGIIAIVGPTASGKTKLGVQLAQQINAEIISVDSMQVFRRMDVGTAKPTEKEKSNITHHLIDILDPDEPYNAGKFAHDAAKIIDTIKGKGKNVILLGGTNLYLKALIRGIIDVPDTPVSVKTDIQSKLQNQGLNHCYQWLSDIDSVSANTLHPNDVARIVRALEVFLTTGKSICDYHDSQGFSEDKYRVLYLSNYFTREELYSRINQRVDNMINLGLIAEVESLLKDGFSADLASMRSIGYKQVADHLSGDLSLEEMITEIKVKSRRYAKKQLTWWRGASGINLLARDFNQWKELVDKAVKHFSSPEIDLEVS